MILGAEFEMTERKRIRHVFIDTQAYVQEKLRFDHRVLQRLRKLGADEWIQILTTESVVGEVRSKLSEGASVMHLSLRQAFNKAPFMAASDSAAVSKLLDLMAESQLIEAGTNIWDQFLKDAKVLTIPSKTIDAGELLQMYFESAAPFGPSDKKCEFPDAISALSLERWAIDNKQAIYVVSGDKDFQRWCRDKAFAVHIQGLREFLDQYSKSEDGLTEFLHTLIENSDGHIERRIEDKFLECGFIFSDDWEADVEDVTVTSITIEGADVIEAEDPNASLSLDCRILFSAHVSGSDYESAIWDSIDREWAYVPKFDTRRSYNQVFQVSLDIEFSRSEGKILTIENILFDDSSEITLEEGYVVDVEGEVIDDWDQ